MKIIKSFEESGLWRAIILNSLFMVISYGNIMMWDAVRWQQVLIVSKLFLCKMLVLLFASNIPLYTEKNIMKKFLIKVLEMELKTYTSVVAFYSESNMTHGNLCSVKYISIVNCFVFCYHVLRKVWWNFYVQVNGSLCREFKSQGLKVLEFIPFTTQ